MHISCISCSYLSRQDLVSWKIALDRRELPGIDKEVRSTMLHLFVQLLELRQLYLFFAIFFSIKSDELEDFEKRC